MSSNESPNSSRLAEWEVAAQAVRLAQPGRRPKGARDRSAHVGYFLIDSGLPQLEAAAQARISLGQETAANGQSGIRLLLYLGATGAITLAVAASSAVPGMAIWSQPLAARAHDACWFCWLQPTSAWPSSTGW